MLHRYDVMGSNPENEFPIDHLLLLLKYVDSFNTKNWDVIFARFGLIDWPCSGHYYYYYDS